MVWHRAHKCVAWNLEKVLWGVRRKRSEFSLMVVLAIPEKPSFSEFRPESPGTLKKICWRGLHKEENVCLQLVLHRSVRQWLFQNELDDSACEKLEVQAKHVGQTTKERSCDHTICSRVISKQCLSSIPAADKRVWLERPCGC
jgi:hypothetical protein